ncbi:MULTISPECIES: aminodeoxychorismate/anthranilate synthase component II [Aerococcus]|uniref:Aminodeoxychorismate/anthranilate synthase component II n=1 Tax=Aerococcus sanguinicola TaxID=119206 RepID=A0A5N1GP58_9LACT|nr:MULTISPECIES: aminodeoxychorismate/anthranilate synthase component II [Aerococcus]KAA9300500.1 aminodeoxychorismate/anthranilate synthase component II [Aerococcus sanguinicola]MDK6369686.1 aminodeoxychorismate/anthranilate synthase component II [Aerococcus sp. UMB9870]MDK6680324.1 aminodeoxychorismate/anthranilate synthase component II [Aerococcus sp. UMB8608]MDK6686904.1 aminodeoxychorismate/anthranilate synthase component II [Aerococcus sp. UMB8623]MDK6940016.1 aminodeoxychorismate/anthra
MILMIDNYDSFSYNLYQLLGELNPDIQVIRNDELSLEEIEALAPTAIVISPGPGRPEDAGVIVDLVRELGPKIPILGVCLGHQAICQAFGGVVTYADRMMHGKQSEIKVDTASRLFTGCPEVFPVARYHSLIAETESLPDCLRVTGQTASGEIMALEHRDYPIYGVQFHPESIMTPDGRQILANFLE